MELELDPSRFRNERLYTIGHLIEQTNSVTIAFQEEQTVEVRSQEITIFGSGNTEDEDPPFGSTS